ncbi:MAG: hypothetical protein AB1489_01170 [Acidobacteriota bacterium]
MLIRYIFLIVLCSSVFVINPIKASWQGSSIDLSLARQYFQETKAVCEQDGGRLWGAPIYGPILFADPETHTVVANQADTVGLFVQQEGVFTGKLPAEISISNTSIDFAGKKWAMIAWPLPEERRRRLRLITHELFHRIQDSLNLPANNPANNHLDAMQGRIWLRLEWRALERALQEQGMARQQAIHDAYYFRHHRQHHFLQSSSQEDLLELNEGLAEYTGFKLSSRSQGELAALIGDNLRQGHNRTSFVRSFAYISGPAYGYLLDTTLPSWRKQITTNKKRLSLSELLYKGLPSKLSQDYQAQALLRAKYYDSDEIIAAETRRDQLRQEQAKKYHARLVEGPLLVLPVTDKLDYSFNPNNLVPFDGLGTVYPTLRAVDVWGILEVSQGALLCREGERLTKIHLPAPENTNGPTITGNGWKLELNTGWVISAGQRKGDLLLKKK